MPQLQSSAALRGIPLEAMSDTQYRTWAGRLIASISGYYVLQGAYLLIARGLVVP
jgi:hypothetical protein